MAELPKNIRVLFESHPKLASLLNNPVVINDSPFSKSIVSQLFSGEASGDDVYRLVFKKGSSRELMTIRSGELNGLSTSIAIEHGKISDHVGLRKVDRKEWFGLLPTLLNLSYLGALRSQIQSLSGVVTDIRNHQILEEQARFERITESVIECVEAIPHIALDNYLRSSYLTKIFKNYEDCFEIFCAQREKLRALDNSQFSPWVAAWGFEWRVDHATVVHPASFFENQLLNSPVFAVFERMVACKVCEMLIVGDYSDEAVNRHIKGLSRPIAQLRAILQKRLNAFNLFSEQCLQGSIENYGYSDVTPEQLKKHREFVEKLNDRIDFLLEGKLKSFDIVRYLSSKENIEMWLLKGILVLNTEEI